MRILVLLAVFALAAPVHDDSPADSAAESGTGPADCRITRRRFAHSLVVTGQSGKPPGSPAGPVPVACPTPSARRPSSACRTTSTP